jgi:hypothetical protein
MHRTEPYCVIAILLMAFVVLPSAIALENSTLEDRVSALERNLSVSELRLDTALKRTTNLMEEIEDLRATIAGLQANLSRLTAFASPSAPEAFFVERISRSSDGNYSVALRWKGAEDQERVTSYSIWYARTGGGYEFGGSVNASRGILRRRIQGFTGGEQILFKIMARNEAGQGRPSYREARIQASAPFLMRWLKILGAGAVVVAVILGIVWRLGRRTPSDGEAEVGDTSPQDRDEQAPESQQT